MKKFLLFLTLFFLPIITLGNYSPTYAGGGYDLKLSDIYFQHIYKWRDSKSLGDVVNLNIRADNVQHFKRVDINFRITDSTTNENYSYNDSYFIDSHSTNRLRHQVWKKFKMSTNETGRIEVANFAKGEGIIEFVPGRTYIIDVTAIPYPYSKSVEDISNNKITGILKFPSDIVSPFSFSDPKISISEDFDSGRDDDLYGDKVALYIKNLPSDWEKVNFKIKELKTGITKSGARMKENNEHLHLPLWFKFKTSTGEIGRYDEEYDGFFKPTREYRITVEQITTQNHGIQYPTNNEHVFTFPSVVNPFTSRSYRDTIYCTLKNATKTEYCYYEKKKNGCAASPSMKRCVFSRSGKKGDTIQIQSTCGGSKTVTFDGKNDYIEFNCTPKNDDILRSQLIQSQKAYWDSSLQGASLLARIRVQQPSGLAPITSILYHVRNERNGKEYHTNQAYSSNGYQELPIYMKLKSSSMEIDRTISSLDLQKGDAYKVYITGVNQFGDTVDTSTLSHIFPEMTDPLSSPKQGFQAPKTPSFSDVPTNNFQYEAIEYVKEKGLVNGYKDGTFKPQKKVSRAEFAKILLLSKFASEEISRGAIGKRFTDVKQGAWYEGYTLFARDQKIFNGYIDGTFKPNNNVTFAEASKIIVNTLIRKTNGENSNTWWKPFFTKLQERGVYLYSPYHEITRGEMAEIISSLSQQ
jgi:predicted DNA-binding antitoxin AbrB/MazE fold protein